MGQHVVDISAMELANFLLVSDKSAPGPPSLKARKKIEIDY